MDPLSQGVIAGVAAQQAAPKKVLIAATLLGVLSGMTPDLDVLIGSDIDPLLGLEYHRHFTHSLFFIPIGSLLCASFFFLLFAKRVGLSFLQTWLYCGLGFASHGLLDACTSYGTQLLWPFSDMRVAWNIISIIDPLFTLPLLLFIILAAALKSKYFSMVALSWVVIYFSAGVIQRERAENAGYQLAESRGHNPSRLSAKPSFANLLVWKVIYETDDIYFVDAIRAGLKTTVYEGDSVAKLDVKRDFPWLNRDSQQAKDIERFRWFSNDFLAVSSEDKNFIVDMRYSLLPHQITGLWGIELIPNAEPEEHIIYRDDANRDEASFSDLWAMITGRY